MLFCPPFHPQIYRVVANPVPGNVLLNVHAIRINSIRTSVVDFDKFVVTIQFIKDEVGVAWTSGDGGSGNLLP